MLDGRDNHGIIKFDEKVYTFGGSNMDAAEIYTIDDNRWDGLPPLPKQGVTNSCIRSHNDIFITSWSFSELLRFDTQSQVYYQYDIRLKEYHYKSLLAVEKRIYLLAEAETYVISTDGRILSTFEGGLPYNIDQFFVMKNGIIYCVDEDGTVYSYEQLTDLRPKEIVDLFKV